MYQPMFAFGVERCFHFLNIAFAIIIRFIYFSALFKREITVLLHMETITVKSYNFCLPLPVDTSE